MFQVTFNIEQWAVTYTGSVIWQKFYLLYDTLRKTKFNEEMTLISPVSVIVSIKKNYGNNHSNLRHIFIATRLEPDSDPAWTAFQNMLEHSMCKPEQLPSVK